MSRCFLFVALFTLLAVSVYAAADLELQQVAPSVDPSEGILRVQIAFSNHGSAASEKLRCRLSLYSGQQLVDSLLIPLNPISAGETRQENLEWKITAPAANDLVVELFDETEPDDHPANNSSRLLLRFPGYSKADLEIADVVLPVTERLEGKTAEINVLIRNKGSLEVRSSVLKINLSQFQKQVASAEKKIGRLQPAEEKQVKMILHLPNQGIALEQVLLEVRCDLNDATVEEIDMTNNVFSKPVLLSIRMPDLASRYVKVDGRGNLSFAIMNYGVAVAKPTVTALYINGSLVRRYNTPELRGGKERRHLYGGRKIEKGAQIAVVVDFNADLEESSEENNRWNYTATPR